MYYVMYVGGGCSQYADAVEIETIQDGGLVLMSRGGETLEVSDRSFLHHH